MGFLTEDRLLIQCSRVVMSTAARTAARSLLGQELDWNYILETSIRHNVSPLFYYGLIQVEGADSLVPPAVLEALRTLLEGSRVRNQRLDRVVAEMVAAFGQAEIPLMGLKDLLLARIVYPDIGLRPMGDIDLLIHRADYERAAACMASLGFCPLPDADIPYTLKYAWAHHFRRPADDVWVDLQWNVMQLEWDTVGEANFDLEIERMWRGAERMAWGSYPLWAPRPEDMLFHLCMHLEGHRYGELVLFCDIAELLRDSGGRLDWQYIVEISNKYQVQSSMYYVLWMVQQLFQASLPPTLLPELRPAYFKAALFEPLFANLTTLHLSLDEIRLAVFPPHEVMARYETVVRQQAAAAMGLFRELERLSAAFVEAGGGALVWLGAPSQRTMPDPLLRPFEPLQCVIVESDLPLMRRALADCGLADAAGQPGGPKIVPLTSQDPLLADAPPRLALQVGVAAAAAALLPTGEAESRKEMALRLVKARLRRRPPVEPQLDASIHIVALAPEEALLLLAARVGQQERDRLFGLCSLIEFLRWYRGPLDVQRIVTQARQRGLVPPVGAALQAVAALTDDERLPAINLALGTTSVPPLRILEWARYGPAALGQYAHFKGLFFFFLSLLSAEGLGARVRYLLRALLGGHGRRPLLPGLALRAAAGLLARRAERERTVTDLAYWVEPESLPGVLTAP